MNAPGKDKDDDDLLGAGIGLFLFTMSKAVCIAGKGVHYIVGRPLQWFAIKRPTACALNQSLTARSRMRAASWVVSLPFVSTLSRAQCGVALAQMWKEQGELSRAYAMYTRVRTCWDTVLPASSYLQIDLTRAQLLQQLGRNDEAIKTLDDLIRAANAQAGDTRDVRLEAHLLSARLLRNDKPADAAVHYQAIISFGYAADAPTLKEASTTLAESANAQGRIPEALMHYLSAFAHCDEQDDALDACCTKLLMRVSQTTQDLNTFGPLARKALAVRVDAVAVYVAICHFFHSIGDCCGASVAAEAARMALQGEFSWRTRASSESPVELPELVTPEGFELCEQYGHENQFRSLDEYLSRAFVGLRLIPPGVPPELRTLADEAMKAPHGSLPDRDRLYDRAVEYVLRQPFPKRPDLLRWVAGHHFLTNPESSVELFTRHDGKTVETWLACETFVKGDLGTICRVLPHSRFSDAAARVKALMSSISNEIPTIESLRPAVLTHCFNALESLLRDKQPDAEAHYEAALDLAIETPNAETRVVVLATLAKHLARAGFIRQGERALFSARKTCDPLGDTMQKLKMLGELIDALDRCPCEPFQVYREAYVDELCQLAWKFWQGGGVLPNDRRSAEYVFRRFRGKHLK